LAGAFSQRLCLPYEVLELFFKIESLSDTYQMPLEKIVVEGDRAWALWEIKEDEKDLMLHIAPYETISETLTNPQKRLEWMAGRAATKAVMSTINLQFQGIVKDEYGKPFPAGYDFQLSLSHSFPYVAILLSKNSKVGIDLEQPKDKLLRIAPRIHRREELLDLGTDIVKHCIYWCAKESLVKYYGKKDLIFAENIFIEPFERRGEGDVTGQIIINGVVSLIPLHYIVYSKFVLVFTL
jgi:4'-phosphopantetheinyl transferase EntD